VKKQSYTGLMGINIDVVYAGSAEGARPSDYAVHLIVLVEKELS
jgi:hypothetical protein